MTIAPYTRSMSQLATYIPPGGNDGFGGRAPPALPVVIYCRWQDASVLFRAPSGELETSSAVVYPDREIAIGGHLVLGDVTDQIDSDGLLDPVLVGAREIRQTGASPSLTADVQLNKAYL